MTNIHRVDFNPANVSAFGDLNTMELTPILQGDFVTGLNRQIWRHYHVFTVTAPASPPAIGDIYTNSNNSFVVAYISGTTLYCLGTGDPAASGNLTRATGAGTTPIAYSAYTFSPGLLIGTGSAITTGSGLLSITTGATTSGNTVHLDTRRVVRYRAGQGNLIRMTPVFANAATNCLQLFGIGTVVNNAPYDGYFWGYESAVSSPRFGIHHYRAGLVVSFTPQSSWLALTSYDPAKGSPLAIAYPYLGFGNIKFLAENPSTGAFEVVHMIQYAGSSSAVQLSNPSMAIMGYVKNTGTASANATITCGSYAAFLSGPRSFSPTPKWAADATSTAIVSATENAILSLRNCLTYNGAPNRGLIRLNQISLGLKEATVVTVRVRIGAILGGTPSWAAVSGTIADNGLTITNGNSIASTEQAATTVASGTGSSYRFNLNIGASGTENIDLIPYDIFVAPGEQMTISAVATGNSTVGCSLNWSEDI